MNERQQTSVKALLKKLEGNLMVREGTDLLGTKSENGKIGRENRFYHGKWKTFILLLVISLTFLGYAFYLTYFYRLSNEENVVGKSIVTDLNFEIETVSGEVVSINQFVGSPLIIDFFATWCAPCEDQVKVIKAFLLEHPDVVVVSVSVDPQDDLVTLAQYREENGISWIIGRDLLLKGSTKFDVFGLPTIVYVDERGIVKNVETRVVPEDQLAAWYQQSQSSVLKVFGIPITTSSSLMLFVLFFLIGLYVVLSPCLFPLMPLTIFNLMGKRINEVSSGKKEDPAGKRSPPKSPTFRKKAIGWTFLLTGGIFLAFAMFSLIGLFISTTLVSFRYELGFFFGVILIILGILMLVPMLEERTLARFRIPSRVSEFMEKGEYTALDLFFLGFLYSIIALPCAGPAILSVIPLVAVFANPFFTLVALIFFGTGTFIPYLLLVLVTTEGQMRIIRFFQRNFRGIQIISGFLIIMMGVLFVLPLIGGPDIIYRFGI